MNAQDVLHFWFEAHSSSDWFSSNPDFDAAIRDRFSQTHRQAAAGELESWRASPTGRLAEIIVLDQFSRNMYRDSAKQFAQDGMALILAQEAIAHGTDGQLDDTQCVFLYLPFMHSESLAMQNRCVALYEALGTEGNVAFAIKHRDIVAEFGRFPHRNAVLGRETTAQEQAFLDEHGRGF